MYRVVERLERMRRLVQSRLSHRNLLIFFLLHLFTSTILFVLSILSLETNANASHFLRHLANSANLSSVMFVDEHGEVGDWRFAPARNLGDASEYGEVVCNDDGKRCKVAGGKSKHAAEKQETSSSSSSAGVVSASTSTMTTVSVVQGQPITTRLLLVDEVTSHNGKVTTTQVVMDEAGSVINTKKAEVSTTSAKSSSTAASTVAINSASAVSSLVSSTGVPSTTIIPTASLPISLSIILTTPTTTAAIPTSSPAGTSSVAAPEETSADSLSSESDGVSSPSSDEETSGLVAVVLAKATRVPLIHRGIARARPASLSKRSSAAVRSARSARSAIAKRQIELVSDDSGDESDSAASAESIDSADSADGSDSENTPATNLTARVTKQSVNRRAATLIARPAGIRSVKRASVARLVPKEVKARQDGSASSDSVKEVSASSDDSDDSADAFETDSESEDDTVANTTATTITSGAVGGVLSVPGLTSAVASLSDKVSSSAEESDDERRSVGAFVKRSIVISQLEKQGRVLGVQVTGLADVFVSQNCAINFGWSINSLDNLVREEIVLAAFFYWIFGMAMVAMLNESIPHLLALLISLTLSTIWTANDLRVSYKFWNNFSAMINSDCAGADILPDYLAKRVGFQGTVLGVNVMTLGVSGWLCWKLREHFGWQTFQRIGASSKINKIYKVVLALSIVLQLDAFVLVTFFALFLDQISRGPASYFMTNCKAWQANYSLLIIMLFPWTYLGWTSIRKEQRRRFNVFLGLSVLLIAGWAASFANPVFRVVFTTWSFFTAIGTLALALTLLSIGIAIYRRTTFGNGLAEYLYVEEVHERPTIGFDEKPGAVLEPASQRAAPGSGGDLGEAETGAGVQRRVLPTFSTTFGPGPAPPRKMFPAPPVPQLQIPERARSRVPSWQAGDDQRSL